MATISITRTIAGTSSDPVVVKLRNSLGTYGIIRNSDSLVVVSPTAAITPIGEDYEYNVDALSAGNYTASWEVTVGTDSPRYYLQVFNIDDSISIPDGVYLRTIEQEVARILGPYDDMAVATSSSNTVLSAYIPELVSSIGYGGIEDRYMLRRGLKSDGSRVAGFNANDRIRSVASVDTSLGIVTSDRQWTNPPINGEVIEFHHLHPSRELRQAVLRGLGRCFFWDRATVTIDSNAQEINLTSSLSWLRNADLIKRVESKFSTDVLFAPLNVLDWKPFQQGGQVYIRTGSGLFPNDMVLTVLRPVNTYVNGSTSLAGPDDDDDILPITLEYARAAGHIEAWRLFPRKLFPVAQTHLYPSQSDAAKTFTMESQRVFHSQSEPDVPRLEWEYGSLGAVNGSTS